MSQESAAVTIGPLYGTHYKQVAGLHHYVWQQAYGPIFGQEAVASLPLPQFEHVWQERLLSQNQYLGLWWQQELAGFAGFGLHAVAGQAELFHFYLHPGCWGKGLAPLLMQQVISLLEQADVRAIVLWVLEENYRAQQFYRKWGFAPTLEKQERQRYGLVLREMQLKREMKEKTSSAKNG